ncbi:TauD/TfdA family dioxygenase [Streptomyces zagrosensis]|uniref:Alpha-ketoglutarate-dependent taurine dioxygenase n=1 Tax=Streptomyces zagrosensis TaxID=1042984 RepID=A0A7W9V1X8_9ACTN|nr:TauD/TfdA family dioxygenase [Streptomyces zagrosensis]MBB5938716.1 alpha-ketoglutarate-dependent taurine dioxygenase [Streptomyces zagrosensis]
MTHSTSQVDTFRHIPLQPFGRVVEAPSGDARITDIPVTALTRWTEESRVLVLRGFELMGKEEFADYCRLWGEILKWEPGEVIDLIVEENPRNYLFASGDVPFHWDGAFVEADPRYFFFQCLDATPGVGGETVFSDTTAVYRDAPVEERERWAELSLTYTTEKMVHYGGETTEKLVAQHPATAVPVLRFAEPLDPSVYKNPVHVSVDGVEEAEAGTFLASLAERLHRPEYCYAHDWRKGDILIADNFALVHGRNAFNGPTTRHLQRVEVI